MAAKPGQAIELDAEDLAGVRSLLNLLNGLSEQYSVDIGECSVAAFGEDIGTIVCVEGKYMFRADTVSART